MIKFFNLKIAIQNITKNKKLYLPYIISAVFMTGFYYIMLSLENNKDITSRSLGELLGYGRIVMAFFVAIILLYTYTFVIKNRLKELGLYAVLGMTKSKILKIVFIETSILAFLTTSLGILVGIIFDKAAYLFLAKLIGVKVVLGFNVYGVVLMNVIIFNFIIFSLIFLSTLVRIIRINIINLLKESKKIEKEPKNRIIISVLAVVFLGYGYYTALSIQSPLEAIKVFFLSVMSVIIGTYLLFLGITITILKVLKNNKKYYYKTKNFIGVSNMLYRMKRNAVGLASICILATMSLVTISTTSSLYLGVDNYINQVFPRDVKISIFKVEDEKGIVIIKNHINNILKESNIEKYNEVSYRFINRPILKKENNIEIQKYKVNESLFKEPKSLIVLTLDDYNRNNVNKETLEDGEIFIRNSKNKLSLSNFKINTKEYKIKKEIGKLAAFQEDFFSETYYVVVKDDKEFNYLKNLNSDENTGINFLREIYNFDIKKDTEIDYKALEDKFDRQQGPHTIGYFMSGIKVLEFRKVIEIYSTFLFVGIFLSLVFLIAQVIIMYYKQITEGFEDKESFDVMQKVGLKSYEIKKSIKSQILITFFLPLIVMIIHIAVGYPYFKQLLELLNLVNPTIYLVVLLSVIAIFTLFYSVIYSITSKVYYNIIK